jgi:ABC-type transport system substrate-binding protein
MVAASRLSTVLKRTARRPLIASLVAGLGMGLLVTTGLAPADTRASGRAGGSLSLGTIGLDYIDPALTIDPASTATSAALTSWALEDATCATLLRYPAGPLSAQDYSLVPEVATGYPAVSPDGRTYTFTIRKGFRFSTGAPVTAGNYARAITRVLNPSMRSPAAQYLQEIVGADEVQRGTAQTAYGVKVVGNRLIVQLTKKVPDFPARMTMPYLCPVPTDLLIDPEGVPAPLPGSGPYYFAEFVRGSRAVLKLNPFYRGRRPHHVDQFVVQVSNDGIANSRKVDTGELDIDLNVPVPRMDELGQKYKVNTTQLFSVPSANMFYVWMNTERPLFRNNVKLRQAVNFALDRPQLLAGLGPPWAGSVTDDYLPPGLPGYVDAHLYPNKRPNLEKARSLASGHTRSRKAVMYTCENLATGCLVNAQTVQANLKAIGIDVEIKQFPLAFYKAKYTTRGEPFDLVFDKLIVPWVDPYQYVNLTLDGRTIQGTGNTDVSYFKSRHYNRLLDGLEALSGRARYDAYGRLAVDVARNAAPMAAVFVRNTRFFVASHVGCLSVSAHGLDLASLCIK